MATNGEKLEGVAVDCDRAIVRATMKLPSSLTPEDVSYITRALASARDALRWAAKRTTKATAPKGERT